MNCELTKDDMTTPEPLPKPAETSGKRIPYFDLAKGVCILLVMWFHLGVHTPFDPYLDAIRMPLYVFLSGLFFKTYGGILQLMYKKTKKLLIPFFFFYLTTSVLLPILAHNLLGINFETGQDWRLLYAFLTYHDFPNIPLWFLWGLFMLNVAFYVLHRFIKSDILLGLCCFVLGIVLGKILSLPASISKAFVYIFYFYLGYMATRHDIIGRLPVRKALPLALLLFVALGFFNPASDVLLYIQQTLLSVAGVLALLLLCKVIKHLPYISYVGRYSIMLLVTHEPLIRLLDVVHIGNPYVCFLILTASYLLIIPFMRRYMPYVTAQK